MRGDRLEDTLRLALRPLGNFSSRTVLCMLVNRVIGTVRPGLSFRALFAAMRRGKCRLSFLDLAAHIVARGIGTALGAKLPFARPPAAPAAAASAARAPAHLLLRPRLGALRLLGLAIDFLSSDRLILWLGRLRNMRAPHMLGATLSMASTATTSPPPPF
jgi:hypothetical protein